MINELFYKNLKLFRMEIKTDPKNSKENLINDLRNFKKNIYVYYNN